ncbi:MAG TPA: flagellar hook capping FlgD N-terminal domain-containing protein [Rhizomicrobium sp.]|nr:flagellar hook capping FlgD N-terminal domain-containing protein [Rhizomicrobium sp.]
MVTPVSSSSLPGTEPPDASKKLSSNFETFLTLLTTQLKNQDPTAPMDSNEFTQQLVMYSQVEQQIDTNTHLKALIGQGTSNAAAMTTGYLGKKVSITNGNASLTAGTATWTYNLAAAAYTNELTISDANGRIVFTKPGDTTIGNHSFTWNGKDASGNKLPDGAYKLTVTAADSNGTAITNSIASAGTVTQIDMTGNEPRLIVGNMEIGLGDIAAVAN